LSSKEHNEEAREVFQEEKQYEVLCGALLQVLMVLHWNESK
jgi:hypothetical protein